MHFFSCRLVLVVLCGLSRAPCFLRCSYISCWIKPQFKLSETKTDTSVVHISILSIFYIFCSLVVLSFRVNLERKISSVTFLEIQKWVLIRTRPDMWICSGKGRPRACAQNNENPIMIYLRNSVFLRFNDALADQNIQHRVCWFNTPDCRATPTPYLLQPSSVCSLVSLHFSQKKTCPSKLNTQSQLRCRTSIIGLSALCWCGLNPAGLWLTPGAGHGRQPF